MILLLIRLFVLVIFVSGIIFLVQWMMKGGDTVRCERCEGKGFWYDARGKEKCDWCKGSGRLPRAK